jgi:ribonuclease HI
MPERKVMTNYIYCDGSTLNNGKPGVRKSGIGAVLICGGERHVISKSVDPDDNHRVEVKAATLALIRALILHPEIADQPITLYSDSEYFVDRFNYVIEQTDPDDLWHEISDSLQAAHKARQGCKEPRRVRLVNLDRESGEGDEDHISRREYAPRDSADGENDSE